MKLYQITSKKTGHGEVIDEDVYNMLTDQDKRKYNIKELQKAEKIVPSEIIKKVTKSKTDND